MSKVMLVQQGKVESVRGYRGEKEEDDEAYKEQSGGLKNRGSSITPRP